MNHALKPSPLASHAASLPLSRAVLFFHSSPVLERNRRSSWTYVEGSNTWKKCNIHLKRKIRAESRMNLLRNVSEYADYLFQCWKHDESTLWFRRPYWSKGAKLNGFSSQEPLSGKYKRKKKAEFDFCKSDDDDDGVENIFQSSFGRERYFYWDSSKEENFQWRCTSGNNHKKFSDWRYETDGETDEDTGVDTCQEPVLASERLTLGLAASGPLKLEEVKSAYRACALRWHPDRHHGATKVMAGEKFKNCSAAYKSLCDSFTSN